MVTPVRVMLVDDSTLVRALMQRALKADMAIDVVASASNAQMALDLLKHHAVDVMVLDLEMPIMDGMTALPKLLEASPGMRIIIASSHSQHQAEMTLQALERGAADYMPKPSQEAGQDVDFYAALIAKIKALGGAAAKQKPHEYPASSITSPLLFTPSEPQKYISPEWSLAERKPPIPSAPVMAIAIAASTGGPQALISLFQQFKGRSWRPPIFITQHMPPNFTAILAEHVSKSMVGDCHEARDDEVVEAGKVYIAPGDFHMTVQRKYGQIVLKLDQQPPENFCRPSADPMLRSLSKVYGKGLLCVVLTGIGADGTRGAAEVVAHGGMVIAQDEATSVVYGMPKSVAEAKLASVVLPLHQMADYLFTVMAS